MLNSLIATSCISFATLYPLLCWTHYGVSVKRSFFQFNQCLALAAAAAALPCLVALEIPRSTLILSGAWLASLLVATCSYWNRDRIWEVLVSAPSVLGAVLFVRLVPDLMYNHPTGATWILSVVGGLIAAAGVYCTTFGHWFLETKGNVPVQYLANCVRLLWIGLGLRTLWDVIQIIIGDAAIQGEPSSMWAFLVNIEGIFLLAAIVVGSLLPLVLMYFVHQTLKISATTSATGLLYGILTVILMGDLGYRYYLLVYGMAL
jgi:hypothetical protein